MILKYNKLRSRSKITLTSIFFICWIWIFIFRSSLYMMVSLHKRFGHLCIKLSPILPVKLKNVISIEFPTLYWFTHSDALDISRHNKKSLVWNFDFWSSNDYRSGSFEATVRPLILCTLPLYDFRFLTK